MIRMDGIEVQCINASCSVCQDLSTFVNEHATTLTAQALQLTIPDKYREFASFRIPDTLVWGHCSKGDIKMKNCVVLLIVFLFGILSFSAQDRIDVSLNGSLLKLN